MDRSSFDVSLLAAPLPEQAAGSLPSLLLSFPPGTHSCFSPFPLCVFSTSAGIQVSPCCSLGIKAPNLGNYRDVHPWQCHSISPPGCNLCTSAEEGRDLAQVIHRRMVLLDNFSCSGLMASSPGKLRSCTGLILFTRTGGVFLKILTEVAKKNKKIPNSTSPDARFPLLGKYQRIFSSSFFSHLFSEYNPSSFSNREAAVIHFSPLMVDDKTKWDVLMCGQP